MLLDSQSNTHVWHGINTEQKPLMHHITANQILTCSNIEQILCYVAANQILPCSNIEQILCYITANQILTCSNIEQILCHITANQILPCSNIEQILCYLTANQIFFYVHNMITLNRFYVTYQPIRFFLTSSEA